MQIYLSEVLDWYSDLSAQQKWDEKVYSPTRKKLLSALESISGYNPEVLLKRLPADALYEERAILLGKMNQHELALSLYVHKVFLINQPVFLLIRRMAMDIKPLVIEHEIKHINWRVLQATIIKLFFSSLLRLMPSRSYIWKEFFVGTSHP